MKKIMIIACFSLSALLLLFFPSSSHAAITVSIVQPSGGYTESNLSIIATVTSTFSINSVKAEVEGRSATLSYNTSGSSNGKWTGTIDLGGLAEGIKTITVTATDVYGSTGVKTANFTYDTKPTVTVMEPINDIVFATPMIRVAATCSDKRGDCVSLKVNVQGVSTVLATGTTSLDQVVSLAEYYNNGHVSIDIIGTDSVGQTTTVTRNVYFEAVPVQPSARLTKVADLPGPAWDYSTDGRALYIYGKALKIKDTISGTISTIFAQTGKTPNYGFLSPKGAIFVLQSGEIYEWRDGNLIGLGTIDASNTLKVKGNYAIWRASVTLIRLNLLTGSKVTVATDIDGSLLEVASVSNYDVDSEGNVAFCKGKEIFKYSGSSINQVTNDPGDTGSHLDKEYPLLDSDSIVYRQMNRGGMVSFAPYHISMYNSASGNTTLSTIDPYYHYPNIGNPLPGSAYMVNNGWVAFSNMVPDPITNFKTEQIWLRSPNGITGPVADFSGNSGGITALGPNGELFSGDYFYQKGKSPIVVATGNKLIYLNNQWYTIIDGSIFFIDTSPDTTPPMVTNVTASSPTNSLSIPVTITASDNVGVTAYLVTNSSTQPAATASGWRTANSFIYTVTADGTYNLYGWAKDTVGNISSQYNPISVTVDRTTPVTTGTSPAANAVNFAGNTITVTFNESMDASTINSSTFIVKSGTTAVAGTVSYNTATKTATFIPSSPLSGGTSYTVTLTTGVKDAAGNSLGSTSTWTFTTQLPQQTFTVTSGSNYGGLITPEGSQSINNNGTGIFTVTPAPGYMVVGVTGSCGGSLNGKTYTTQAVVADCTVGVLFAKADVSFNEDSYLAANQDVMAAVRNGSFNSGWEHYVNYGKKEGRTLSLADYSAFDEAYYFLWSPDVASAVKAGWLRSGWAHYANYGWEENRKTRFTHFNEDAYLAANPDIAAIVNRGGYSSGWQHYSLFGLMEGRAAFPSGYQNFSENSYLAANKDVAAVVKSGDYSSGWEHYVKYGRNEGRALSPTNYGTFNEDAYLAANADVAAVVRNGSYVSGWSHYVLYGQKEGRATAPLGYTVYNENAYLAANPDVAALVKSGAFSSGWEHYAKSGVNEGRSLAPVGYVIFDEYAYLAANYDVAAAVKSGRFSSGWAHYVSYGKNEGRALNTRDYGSFNEGDYLAANPDVHKAVLDGWLKSGWEHYQQYGKSEGRALTLGSPMSSFMQK